MDNFHFLDKAITRSILRRESNKKSRKIVTYHCVKCDKEIPMGRNGRTCKECRNKDK